MASGEMSAPALRPEGRAVKGDTLIRRDRDPAMPSTFSIADWKKLVKEHPEAAGADAVPKALESYSKAEAKDDPEGLFLLGRVKQAQNDLDGALRLFRQSARLLPEAYDTLMNLKMILFQLGETQEADEVGKRLLELQKKRDAELQGR